MRLASTQTNVCKFHKISTRYQLANARITHSNVDILYQLKTRIVIILKVKKVAIATLLYL